MNLKNLIPFSHKSDQRHPITYIQRQMNDLFNDFFEDTDFSRSQSLGNIKFPLLDVAETDKEIKIKAELPGLSEKDIKLEARDNVLIMRGEKKNKTEEKDKEGTYYMQEISYGSFVRSLSLPFSLAQVKISAEFKEGILSIIIEKPEEAQKQIQEIKINT